MPAQIRPTRLDVTDRFPMLGFRIRDEARPSQAEIVIAADPALFTPEGRANRTAANFWSSRGNGALRFQGEEASFTLPPEVLARFIGNEKLYYGLATGGEGGAMKVAVAPTPQSPYIKISGLSGRSMTRIRVLPSRQQRSGGYGQNGQGQLEWAGDAAQPGMTPLANGAAPNGAANGATNGATNGAVPYDDGFGPLPTPAADPAPPAAVAAQGLGSKGVAYPPVRALSDAPVPVSPPEVSTLGWVARQAAELAISAAPGGVGTLLNLLISAANQLGCSVGIGPQIGGGLGAGGALGYGLIFGKDGDLGVYGSAEIDIGFITSISATAVVTIVQGGLDAFSGWNYGFAISGGEGIVGGAMALLNDRSEFVGVSANVGIGAGFSPVDFYVAAQRGWSTRVQALAQAAFAQGLVAPAARSRAPMQARGRHNGYANGQAATGGRPARALDAGSTVLDIRYRCFIPSPLIDSPFAVYGGDGRGFQRSGGTSRGDLHARVTLTPGGGIADVTTIDRHWGESTEYATADTYHVEGQPDWWMDKVEGAQPTNRATLAVSDDNLKIMTGSVGTARNVQATIENASIVSIIASGGLPLSYTAPAIDADIAIMIRPTSSGGVECKVVGEHDGFPCHELYINGVFIYGYDPVAAGSGPMSLNPPMDITAGSDWVDCTASGGTFAQEFGARPRARGLSGGQSFTINWDEVYQVAQPTDVSCWATSAAMVLGWRDRQSISIDYIASCAGLTTATGLDPAAVGQFAADMGLIAEPPQSYSIEGFRQLLEANGPLWVGAAVPGLHAIVVTGFYSDGTDSFVRITDPWDRTVGTPGAPGAYAKTHTTGSRYIMKWEDFVAEYERAATNFSAVNLQILHCGGTFDHTANTGASTPEGYAMAKGLSRGKARGMAAGAAEEGEVLLPPPPAPRARAMSGAEAAIAIGGFLLETVRDSAGDVTWELDQFRERKHPNDIAPSTPPTYQDAPTIRLDNWPVTGGQVDDISAWFAIDWQYSGQSLGNVRITNIGTNDAVGWSLNVRGQIMDDNILYPPNNCAALRVRMHYRFSRGLGSDWIAITDVHLYGDGTHEISSQWVQAETLALGSDPRRARALDGGAGVVVSAIGIVVGAVTSSQGDVAWQLDAFNAIKHPNDVAPNPNPPMSDARPILIEDWTMGLIDEIGADFAVDWQFNGTSVGNIRVRNTYVNDAVGMGLNVKATIAHDNAVYDHRANIFDFDPEGTMLNLLTGNAQPAGADVNRKTCSAMRVTFDFTFDQAIGPYHKAQIDLHLFGDGTYSRYGRWVQHSFL